MLSKYLLTSGQLKIFIKCKKSLLFETSKLESAKYSSDRNIKKKYILASTKEKNLLPNTKTESDLPADKLKTKLSSDLVHWAVSFKITNQAFSKLLNLLVNHGISHLPQTSAVLYKKQENDIKEISVPPGTYVHYGIETKLKELIEVLSGKNLLRENNIKLTVFIDHLLLKKTSNKGFWIILGSISGHHNTTFVIGAYTGNKLPENSNLFLENFVEEVKYLYKNGLKVQKTHYEFKIERLICDAPAKVFILNTKGFSGYSSCTKCNAAGEYINKKICLPRISSLKKNEDYLQESMYKRNEVTKLLDIPGFGVVSNIPLDYMHLVCIGVVKKLLMIWLADNTITDEMYEDFPCEFVGKIKPIKAFKDWSPGQCRHFLLHYGPVVMRHSLSQNKYLHFLKLHVACRILCLDSVQQHHTCTADILLREFVTEFMELYGKDHMTHNVHGLYHLAEDSRLHGTLDDFSAFPFEKYLRSLKNSIVRTRKKCYLQTVLKISQAKLFEKTINKLKADNKSLEKKLKTLRIESESSSSENQKWHQFERLKLKNWKIIGGKDGDDHVLLNDGKLVRVLNILEKKDMDFKFVFVRGVELSPVSSFYEKPVNSAEVEMYLVGRKETKPFIWPVSFIYRKCVKISTRSKDKYVLCTMMNNEFC